MSEETPRTRRGAAGRGERRRGAGLASALAGAGLLVVLGFALGVVGGLVMEEPDLLLDYVLGRTEQVAVGGEPAAVPDVAAEPPGGARAVAQEAPPSEVGADAEVAEAPAAEAAPTDVAPGAVASEAAEPEVAESEPAAPPAEEATPAVASPPPAGSFAVQVGAFAEASAAEQLARRLRARGYPVYLAPSADADTARWRVRVGPVTTRAEAESMAGRLDREERIPTWVLAEGPS